MANLPTRGTGLRGSPIKASALKGTLLTSSLPTSGRLLASDCSAHSVTGTVSETVLKTFSFTAANLSVPANSIIVVQTLWSYTNSANAKNIRIKIGATGAGTGGTALVSQGFTTTASYARDCVIFCRGTNSQYTCAGVLGSHEFSSSAAVTTAAIDLTANWELALTGTLANTGETITLESAAVFLHVP